tara:strand:+ start:466 stop:2037 length:1572 start_codon:yes stop_codon:yes gene_type:complete
MAVTKQQIILEFDAETGQLTGKLNDVNQSVEEVSDSTSVLTNQLDKMTGGAVSGFKNAVAGTQSFVKGLQLTRAAIIATGIGALVIGVVALVKAFTQTEEGARRLKKAFAPVQAVVDVLMMRISALGGAIVKLFSRDWEGAAKDLGRALAGNNDEYARQIKLYDQLIEREFALEDARIKQTVETAKIRAEIKELNLVAEDTTRTIEERQAAAAKAGELERNLFEERKAQAEEELAIARLRLKNSNTLTEDRKAVAELEAQIFDLARESLELQTTLNNKLNILREEGARKEQEALTKEIELMQKTVELNQERVGQQEEVNNETERGLIIRKDAETVATGIVETESQKRRRIRKEEFSNTIDLLEDEFNHRAELATASFAALSALNSAFSADSEAGARKAFKRNKALALATAITQTAQGIITQLAVPQDALTGQNFIKAAIVAATGAAQVAQIKQSQFQGGGDLSSSIPRPNEGGVFGGAPQLDLGFLGGGAGQDGPIQAFVIAQNVSNAQQANQQVQDQANLGG